MNQSRVLGGVVAGVLLVAAGLKAHQLLTLPEISSSLLETRPFQIMWVLAESALALAWVAGHQLRQLWALTVLVVLAFIVVTTGKLLTGADDCGCFGRLHMHPGITLLIDLALLALVLAGRPAAGPEPRRWFLTGILLLVWLGCGSVFAWKAATWQPARLGDDGQVIGSGPVLIDPEVWTGRTWPLVSHLAPDAAALNQGAWQVLLYHYDCPHCLDLIADWTSKPEGTRRRAYVSCPPHAPPGKDPVPEKFRRLQLSPAYDWFVATPLVLELDDGRVRPAGDTARLAKVLASGQTTMAPIVVPDRLIDLGFVPCRTQLLADIRMDDPRLRQRAINRISSSCTCLLAGRPETTGQGLTFRLAFEAPRRPTDYDKTILLHSAYAQPPIAVRITARVGRPISLDPERVLLPFRSTASLRITNARTQPLRLLAASCTLPGVVVDLPAQAIAPTATLTLTLNDELGQAGDGMISLLTDDPEAGTLNVPVRVGSKPTTR